MTGAAYRTDLYPTTELGPFARREATVYELDPPYLHREGVTQFVIAATNERARMVDLFPAYESGVLAEWEPLNVGLWGTADPVRALAELGYEVVSVGGRS